jgi:hypothetical protein
MKTVQKDFRNASTAVTSARVSPTRKLTRHKTPRDCPRVTLRLSQDDHARLKEMADGMALATFIRAKVRMNKFRAENADLRRRLPTVRQLRKFLVCWVNPASPTTSTSLPIR